MTKKNSILIEQLGLKPHPEGGWYREIWHSDVVIPQTILGDSYQGNRYAASSIYFLLQEGEESAWHKVMSDEIWLSHSGSPVAITIAPTKEQLAEGKTYLLGANIANGEMPQVLVKKGEWQMSKPIGSEPALVSCIVSPAFTFDDFELIDGPL
ncbi:cupin domain-containing protein [Isobaculum melis]|uniref:DUF985 domain-containing protein n=1 Tax=Isobaculum melis TaxID=142588 RepID=A0A1H9R625_9LACT|nr:cupin domain-containing protein [Isobaculum melis]SER68204.1 hypothetical protein SAMN04488559_10384 [Isobaculum melis]